MVRRQGRAADNPLLSCSQCNRRFTRPENLVRHAKTHERHAQHACKICGRTFVRSDVRNKHERLHERTSLHLRNSRTKSIEADTPRSGRNDGDVELLQDSAALQLPRDPTNESSTASQRRTTRSVADHLPTPIPQMGQTNNTMAWEPLSSNLIDQSLFTSSTRLNAPYRQDPYFDYASFARTWDDPVDLASQNNDWFSDQFFAAVRETDLWTTPIADALGADLNQNDASIGNVFGALPTDDSTFDIRANDPANDSTNVDILAHTSHNEMYVESASRVPSPPNEASHEDRIPFAWDPSSKVIEQAKVITLSESDPIFALIDSELSLSNETFFRVQEFLRSTPCPNQSDTFSMPQPRLVNVFMVLFFSNFMPQACPIHTPTTDINDLPPPLLAIMMAIGSTYSRLRHSRRLGIILFDRIRLGLLSVVEHDNSQMREPWIIYSFALTCFMGVWCGNKRTFELAEIVRATAVTYTRHLPSSKDKDTTEPNNRNNKMTARPSAMHSHHYLHTSWGTWAISESHKRVRWFVYTVDTQFPSLLGIGGMMTLGDIRKWECPCDDQYWRASSARSWSNLVGTAARPSSPYFGPVAASFVSQNCAESFVAAPPLNDWTAFLVLTIIVDNVFRAEQRFLVHRMVSDGMLADHSIRSEMITNLESWYHTYGQVPMPLSTQTPASYFKRSSIVLYHLARIFVHLPLSDIQDCLGRNGADEATIALGNIGVWMQQNRERSSIILGNAALCVDIILKSDLDNVPFDLIGLFLCHLTIWAYAIAGEKEHKLEITSNLRRQASLSQGVIDFIEAGFGVAEASSRFDAGRLPQLIMRHAIQSLVRKGTWGASSNLALLLHLHPEYQA